MISMFRSIRKVSGNRAKTLVLPVVLSCVDSIFHMGMFSLMIITIIDLLNGTFTQQKLLAYTIILIGLFLVRAVLFSVNYTRTQYRGSDITAGLRLSLGDHVRSLNLGYFNKNSIGQLTSTLTTDIADFENVLSESLSGIIKAIFFSVLAFVFAFGLDWRFALIVLALVMISLPLVHLGGKMAGKFGGRQRKTIHNVISRVVEYISGIKTFKLYNLTGGRFERLDKSFKELKKSSIWLELAIMPFSIMFSIITSMIIPIALIMGTRMLGDGNLTAQNFIAIIMVSISISNMMSSLGSLYPQMNYLNKAAENILAVKNEKPLPFKKERADFTNCAIQFENVGFRYTDDVEVLKGISFTARPGTTTALIGPSGSGKTTIISLVSRFWDVTTGKITIDGQDIRNISPDALASQISVVFQDVYLLNDTIANNIRIGKQNASMEEIHSAAKSAQCHEFIMALPEGYNTVVGEGGSTLSGGEKQRISIARALIKDAPIVLLDESTSSLDADNEFEINKALDMLMKNKTVIVIAHRLNTIKNANNILVLDDGSIRERGSHNELIAQGGWYAQMMDEQEKARNWTV